MIEAQLDMSSIRGNWDKVEYTEDKLSNLIGASNPTALRFITSVIDHLTPCYTPISLNQCDLFQRSTLLY